MKRWLWLFAACVLATGVARAQGSPPTTTKQDGAVLLARVDHGPTRAQAEAGKPPGHPPAEPDAWKGPRVALSYRLYSLRDWQGGRRVSTAAFTGFLPTRFVRAGGGVEAGGRRYENGPGEGLLSGNLFVGYQHLKDLGRLLPYLVAVGELGFTFGKRFHTPISHVFRGIGLELGADVNLVRGLHVGIGVSFMVYTMDDLMYDTFGLRLSIGL